MYPYLMLRTWILALAVVPVVADVTDSAPNGFTSKITLQIQAAPEAVYTHLIQIGAWWDSAHTFSGDSKNLSIEEKSGGCFCEKLPKGGGVRHLEVVNFAPGKTLVLSGGLGPLQSMGATGALSIQLAPSEGGTKLLATYAVTGYFAAGMNTLAAPVDGVLASQFRRLKNLIEQGNPAPKAP
jgi:hypothetical protein